MLDKFLLNYQPYKKYTQFSSLKKLLDTHQDPLDKIQIKHILMLTI